MTKPIDVFRMASGLNDTQTVTTGSSGIAPNRVRGFFSGAWGSIADGTSNLYSGAAILVLEWEENGAGGAEQIVFKLTGVVSNSGWDTLTIDGATTLLRSAATFTTPGGNSQWVWGGGQPNVFGAASSNHTCVFG